MITRAEQVMGNSTGAESALICLTQGRCLGGLSAEGRQEQAEREAQDPLRVCVGGAQDPPRVGGVRAQDPRRVVVGSLACNIFWPGHVWPQHVVRLSLCW